MKKNKIGILLIMCFFTLFGCSKQICPICGNNHVIHSYFNSVGLEAEDVASFSSIVSQIGDPPNIIYTANGSAESIAILQYNTFNIAMRTQGLNSDKSKWEYYYLEIISPDIKLSEKIYVGTARKNIISAYKNAIAIKEYNEGEAYYDTSSPGMRFVRFVYDESDCVISIIYYA